MLSERKKWKELSKKTILPIKEVKIMILRNATKKKTLRKKQSKPTNYAIDKQRERAQQQQAKEL